MGEKSVYGGKGVVKTVENINNLLAPELLGFDTRSVSQSVSQNLCSRTYTELRQDLRVRSSSLQMKKNLCATPGTRVLLLD